MKRPRRLAALAALYGRVALAGWVAAGLTGLGSATAGVEHADAPTALGEHGASGTDTGSGSAALSDPPLTATPPVLFAAVSPTDPVQNAAKPSVSSEACLRHASI